MTPLEQLRQLYAKQSKHSNYQVLASRLGALVGAGEISVRSRSERERMDYFRSIADFHGKKVLDIGGNTGFFSFEALESGAATVDYVEGNAAHAEFVSLAAEVLGVKDRLHVQNRYFMFNAEDRTATYDLVLLLNVLHHLGDDFGDQKLSIDAAKKNIATMLNGMASVTSTMIFQLGFNWKGDRNTCLFEHGTKRELIDFITEQTAGHWTVERIGIAEQQNGKVVYAPLNETNIERQDSLGEFLNRPVFLLRSLR